MTDLEIARKAKLKPVGEIAEKLNISQDDIEQYGKYKAKLDLNILNKPTKEDGKLVLVTAISPTPAGEGKTTVSIGLSQGLNKLGDKSVVALREPSLGPCFGIKGGAAGGGYAQVGPMEDINLHFTGDIHAIGTAHNLIAACLDNHLKWGNELNIDISTITFKRCMDMNERALKRIRIATGEKDGPERDASFQITVASEIMATLCLSNNLDELKNNIGKITLAYTKENKPVTVADLKVHGAAAVLLKDAIKPNLVQTIDNTPAIIHGGPFANIAHGCNSILATKMALKLGDYAITEAGFAADLGAEKFLDIKVRKGNLKPKAIVLVATIRALKYHGDAEDYNVENLAALEKGMTNLDKHYENLTGFNLPVVVAINQFATDTDAELDFIQNYFNKKGIKYSLAQVWAKGGDGALDLAEKVKSVINHNNELKHQYELTDDLQTKIEKLAVGYYGADKVEYSDVAKISLAKLEKEGKELPICVAKTQKSISDNAKLRGRPTGFTFNVREIKLSSGAGFILVFAGTIMDMPGLPKIPSANSIDIVNGVIEGLF